MSELQSWSLESFLDKELPPREFLFEPWIQKGEQGMIYAETGIGKTWFSLSIALALASGGSVGSFRAPKPSKVLYIDGEMSLIALQERLKIIVGFMDGDKDQALQNFHLLPSTGQDVGMDMPDLADPEQQKILDEEIDKYKPDVLFLDNLSTLIQSGDENKAEDFMPVRKWLKEQGKKGITVIVVHHSGKNGGDQRGSSAKKDTMDWVLKLERPDKALATDRAQFIMQFTKYRELFNVENKALRLSLDTHSGWQEGIGLSSDQLRLKEFVEMYPEAKQVQLCELMGWPRSKQSTISTWLADFKQRGLLS